MTGSPIVLLLATLGIILLLTPALVLFFGGVPDRRRVLLLAVAAPATLVLAGTEWLILGSDLGVAVFQGAVAAASLCTILSVGLRTGHARGYLLFGGLWVSLVLVPVGFSLFDVRNGLLLARLGTLDFGGASIIAICTGTAAMALAAVSRPLGNAVGSVPRGAAVLVSCAIAGLLGWLALSGGAELVVDETTLIVARNELIGAAAGAAGWMITQVVNVHRATIAGLVAGIFAGSVVILASSPWLTPLAVIVLGIGAGALGHVSAAAGRRRGVGPWATLVAVLLVPGAGGFLATGIVAAPAGLIFSGHGGLLASEVGGLVLVVGYGFAVTFLLAVLVDRTVGLLGSSRLVDEAIVRLYRAYASGDEDAVRGLVHPEMQWPPGWDWRTAPIPSRSRRLRGGEIAVSFPDSAVAHHYSERDGLFDRMELA